MTTKISKCIMEFKQWLKESELDSKLDVNFVDELAAKLGSNEPDTLNYGGLPGMSPFLYVPASQEIKSITKSIRKNIENSVLFCRKNPSTYSGWECSTSKLKKADTSQRRKVGDWHKTRIFGPREKHVTVALGFEIDKYRNITNQNYDLPPETSIEDMLIAATLRNGTRLFRDNEGIAMKIFPVTPIPTSITLGPAKVFKTPLADIEGNPVPPVAVLMPVKVQNLNEVREALMLPPRPPSYIPHITVGYIYPHVDDRGMLTTFGMKNPMSAKSDAIKQVLRSKNIN